MTKKIAITGGRGFIGSHVAYWAEAAGHEVRFFDKRDGHDIMGDLSALSGVDSVIHLAGVLGTLELFDSVEDATVKNVLGTVRVAEFCRHNNIQMTNILVPDVFPSVYCATKAGAKRVMDVLHSQAGLRCSHVTAFNAFGPGQAYGPGHPRKFGPTFSIAAWNGKPIPIWGDGSALIDPVPVSVVARMLVDATDSDDNAVFDGGIGVAVTVNEIALLVLEITGSEAGVSHEVMRAGESPTNVPATGRCWDRLDWSPTDTDWHAALVETVEWYRGKPFEQEVAAGWVAGW